MFLGVTDFMTSVRLLFVVCGLFQYYDKTEEEFLKIHGQTHKMLPKTPLGIFLTVASRLHFETVSKTGEKTHIIIIKS